MYINFSKLIDLNYLQETPPTVIKYFWPLLVVFIFCLIVAIICWILNRRRNRPNHIRATISIVAAWLGYPAIIGLCLLFFRNQGIMFLSWRLWLMLLVIVWLAGIISIVIRLVFQYPKEKKAYELQSLKRKYIPKSKKSGG